MADSETNIQAVKGMNDLLPPESQKWAFVEARARDAFERHGYREIRTPIVEYTPLFARVGEATDIVEKQMYTFNDRDERSLSLRPEGTASCVRAFLEHAVHKQSPVTKWWYSGPMFRHERQQKGRYRQFYQMGVEALGIAEPSLDAEQIAMLLGLFSELGIPDLEVVVNSVGGPDDRPAFRAALVAYFTPHLSALCEDCRRRLHKNPLRILDCKVAGCQALVAGAPSITDHLGEASRAHFEGMQAALHALDVPHRADARLVRGLDYYTGTIFEIARKGGDLGALGGGGRYDLLVAEMNGPVTPATGFAFGMERVVLSIPKKPEEFDPGVHVFLASHGAAGQTYCLRLAHALRQKGFRAEIDHRGGSMKSQLKRADKLSARAVVIVGEAELAQKAVMLRDMKAATQELVAEADLVAALEKVRA